MEQEPLSRAELLSGEFFHDRRAARLLAAIETRCAYMRDESERVVAAYLLEGAEDFRRNFQDDYFSSLKIKAGSRSPLLLDHFERFASHWKHLVPDDPDLRARIIHLTRIKYGPGVAASPCVLNALGANDPGVQTVYAQLFGQSLQNLDHECGGDPEQERAPSAARTRPIVEDIEAGLEWLTLASGDRLFSAGEASEALYVVISGRLRATTTAQDGTQVTVDEIGRGELVGEMHVLAGEPSSVTVTAIRDSELVRLGRDKLLALAQRHLEVMLRINALISRRLRKHYEGSASEANTVLTLALVPCDASVPVQDFGRQLATALGEFGPAIYLTGASLDEAVEPGASRACLDDPCNARILAWLSELESRYRYVIYESSADPSEWSNRCVRQADRILLLGPSESPVRQSMQGTEWDNSRVDLVLLHPSGATSAARTAAWLGSQSFRAYHHVRSGNRQDMTRLVRRLTGRAFGLVLGGGGARGFGHIGALRALREAGLTPDEIGGTSMGALMAAGFAMGMDDLAMQEFARHMPSRAALLDRTLPLVSFYSTRKITDMIRKLTGTLDVEDLWLPYFCVSANLSQGCEMVHTTGPLWQAVRASMAASPIFTPILYQGDLLVDGGFLNNLPVDIMRRRVGGATVIGIDCSPLSPRKHEYEFGPSISTWQALREQMTPPDRRKGPPNMLQILPQIMDTNGLYRLHFTKGDADLIVRLPTRGWGMLDFDDAEEIIQRGYEATCEQLAAWLPDHHMN